MTGYDFHPEAFSDLDEIWEFIRADSPDAADRMIAEILSRTRALVGFPNQGYRRPDLTSRPLRFVGVREYLVVYCTGRKAAVDYRRHAWPPQPAHNGRNSQGS
jgi:plasmid stabilization system protein ParE